MGLLKTYGQRKTTRRLAVGERQLDRALFNLDLACSGIADEGERRDLEEAVKRARDDLWLHAFRLKGDAIEQTGYDA